MVELHGSHVVQMAVESKETFTALWTDVYIDQRKASVLFRPSKGPVNARHTANILTPDLDFVVISASNK
jgi:hypothetical protein